MLWGAGQQGARLLEVSLRAVGEAMAALQQLWLQVAPHSQWCAQCLPGASFPRQ